MKRRYGLTLIEMMGVAILLGIMAIVAGQAVYKSIENGRNRTVASDLRSIADAIELYSIERNTFPADLTTLVNQGYLRDAKDIRDKWASDDSLYGYCVPSRAGNGHDGLVFSLGPNGEKNIQYNASDCSISGSTGDDIYEIIRVGQ